MRVRLEGISQSYGARRLFAGLTLDIPSGELFTLLGPSGCGKTTLLRMLAGFVAPDAGRILFGERDVTALPAHRRGVGMVFQDYALFPDRSVLANVAYGLDARGMRRDEARARALAMLDRVGLKDLAGRSPGALSGGQRQRVATARALVIGPELLLLDEPLSALDVKLRVELRALVRELQQEARITTVFVTHDQEEALSLSDHVAVMDHGRIVQIGAPEAVYGAPASGFAADFIGSANVLAIERIEVGARPWTVRVVIAGHAFVVDRSAQDADVAGGGGAGRTGAGESGAGGVGVGRISMDGRAAGGNGVDGSGVRGAFAAGMRHAALAVRREAIILADATGAPDGLNEIDGTIEIVEFRGSVTGYRIATPIGTLFVDAWTAAAGRPRRRGEGVRLRLPEGAVIVESAP